MSRQIGPLNRSLSSPSNLQRHSSRISISDLTSSPLPNLYSNSPRMYSDDSTKTVIISISNFKSSDRENPDEFLDSEHSPTSFSQPLFQPIASQLPDETSPSPSSYTDAALFLSPMSSKQPDAASPMTDNQLKHELDIFITQHHLHGPNNAFALTIHQLTHSASTSKCSTHSVHIAPTGANRVFKQKHPNTTPQFLIRSPRSSRLQSHHPQQYLLMKMCDFSYSHRFPSTFLLIH